MTVYVLSSPALEWRLYGIGKVDHFHSLCESVPRCKMHASEQDVFAFEVLIVSILNLADSAAKQGFHFGYLGPL